ncbi:MAG: mechanosensitive ion channel [Methylococcales bacterium]|nr:mechanosensitive ion channel [Methylococcales bacterium]
MPNEQLTRIFRNLDTSAWLELLLIGVVTVAAIQVMQVILPWLANRLHGRWRYALLALVPLLRLLLMLAGFLLMVPRIIEPSLQNMVAIMGSLGLALGFALKDYAASLIAGVIVVGERPYRNGDWVEFDGHYGEVRHVGMRTVQLHTPDDSLVFIPHLKLWQQAIINANNGTASLQCVVKFYLPHDHDARQVRALLTDVALTCPYLRYQRPIAVMAREYPWGLQYRVKVYPIDPRQQYALITDLTVRGRDALSAWGIGHARVPVSVSDKSDQAE